MVALGGSVSAGHGVLDPGNGWVSRVFAWIEDAFPGQGHRLLNRAIPATTSGYTSACVPELVPDTTDLVIVEYTYNDYVLGGGSKTLNNPARQGSKPSASMQKYHSHTMQANNMSPQADTLAYDQLCTLLLTASPRQRSNL